MPSRQELPPDQSGEKPSENPISRIIKAAKRILPDIRQKQNKPVDIGDNIDNTGTLEISKAYVRKQGEILGSEFAAEALQEIQGNLDSGSNHALLKEVGEAAGKKAGVRFLYTSARLDSKDESLARPMTPRVTVGLRCIGPVPSGGQARAWVEAQELQLSRELPPRSCRQPPQIRVSTPVTRNTVPCGTLPPACFVGSPRA